MTSSDVIQRSEQRRHTAEAILHDLDLMNRWRRFGRPVLVGALAIDVAVAPDIDMEIYCPDLKIEHGFQVISECAMNPRVTSAQFINALNTPDKALYWQLHYCDEAGIDWKVDMWSAPEDYALPRGEHFVQPMKAALTPETRMAILTLKEARAAGELPMFLSVDLYRAVIEGGVRTPDQWRKWQQTHETGVLTDWKPAILSVCGCDCALCEHFKSLQCAGCSAIAGRVWWTQYISTDICPIYRCVVMDKQLKHCGFCQDMPCATWRELKDPSYSDEQHETAIQQRSDRLRVLAGSS